MPLARSLLRLLPLALAALVAGRRADAQPVNTVRPYFLLSVDTSGSMNYRTTCPAGRTTNSCGFPCQRINDVACVVQHIADGVGDAVFGLETFPFQCSNSLFPNRGHYDWVPGYQVGFNSCGVRDCVGCTGTNCRNALGCADAGQMIVPIAEGNNHRIRVWGDGSFTGCGVVPAPGVAGGDEISTLGGGDGLGADGTLTPLGGILRVAVSYFQSPTGPLRAHNGAAGTPDPYAHCRPYNIILLTDGDENCVENGGPFPAMNAARSFGCLSVDLDGDGTISDTGRYGAERNRDLNADGDCYDTGEQPAFRTRLYVIGFGYPCYYDPLEDIAIAGGTSSPFRADCGSLAHRAFYAQNEVGISQAINTIVAASAQRELCNGVDDNCNALVDEGYALGVSCSAGVGACARTGATVCNTARDDVVCSARAGSPTPENTNAACSNSLDDDCDGRADCADSECASLPPCRGGCVATAEVCDGRDNDCDGLVDEGSLTRPCGLSVGVCTAGTQTCVTQTAPGDGTGRWTACTGTAPGTERCDGLDNNCNGAVDEGLSQPCGTDVGECQRGVQLCVGGRFSDTCTGELGPTAERCDNRDNDCDGMTDEGDPGGGGACGSSVGACRPGRVTCASGILQCQGATVPTTEVCNGLDDNCDGVVDEGVAGTGERCAGGVSFPTDPPQGACRAGTTVCRGARGNVCEGAVGPSTEVCDGVDNDCDGMTDEGNPGGGTACGREGGRCTRGATQCVGGRLTCVGGTEATEETCNGLDDDCDGMTDEGLPTGGPCAPGGATIRGECVAGVLVCRGGAMVCDGGVGPRTEVCDGLDNDCDGTVDNGDPGGGVACGSSVGECRPGVRRCVDGRLLCVGEAPPRPEECDCRDNDCDGVVDNPGTGGTGLCGLGAVCAGGAHCACLRPCSDNELAPCPPGRVCERVGEVQLCVGDLCAGVRCPTGQTCLRGVCRAPCDGVTCATGLTCDPATATCVDPNDCRQHPELCGAGTICRARRCVPDPCASVTCPSGQACYNGVCGASCVGMPCPAGQACHEGTCRASACGGPCPELQSCDPAMGRCVLDRCRNLRCARFQACDPLTGVCDDDPCAVVRCPSGQYCANGDCTLTPRPVDPVPVRDRAVAAGGSAFGSCSASPSGGARGGAGLWALGALGALAVLLRRRRGAAMRGLGVLAAGACALAVSGCDTEPYCFNCGIDAVAPVEIRTQPDALEVREDTGEPEDDVPMDRPDTGVDACTGVDYQTDPRHCGGCDRRCALAHAFPACEAGRCVVRLCDTGFYDLDRDPTNGCEYACSPVGGATTDTTCDRRDDDCDGRVDEDVDLCADVNHCGACGRECRLPHATARCARTGTTGACAADSTECRVASCAEGFRDVDGAPGNGCEYECTPSGAETCDGRDNDCDGMTDEGDPGGGGSCGSSVGACRLGVLHCNMGALRCEGSVVPAAETCDGVDNDCDGTADNGSLSADARVGAACGSGTGDCRQGTNVCMGGRVVCTGAVEPREEACDGRDNDCDGAVDDGNPGGGGTCGRTAGICRAGTLRCMGGGLACVGATDPQREVCDGADNDCDGTVDNGVDLMRDPSNCGACGTVCTGRVAHGVTTCEAGACRLLACEPGYWDDPRSPATDCDYACTYQSPTELCNGADDDCDGAVDEGVAAPAGLCRTAGACAGTVARCDGARGFVCPYGTSVEVDTTTGQPVAVETRCDGLDGNCNGAADESFTSLGESCSNGGVGACGATGRFVCNTARTGVACGAPPVGMARDEVCNGLDDDCDGSVDETAIDPGMDPSFVRTAWVAVSGSGASTRWIMQYEASRPGATASSPGPGSNRACSAPGVIPWTNLTTSQAAAACFAAGASLCTEAEWVDACRVSTRACGWSYATTCTTYQTATCNGSDYDVDPATTGVQNGPTVTGALASCYADWSLSHGPPDRVYDLSGNVKEFTAPRTPGVNPLRGGAYSNIANGTSCGFDWTVVDDAFAFSNVGFRCCYLGPSPP